MSTSAAARRVLVAAVIPEGGGSKLGAVPSLVQKYLMGGNGSSGDLPVQVVFGERFEGPISRAAATRPDDDVALIWIPPASTDAMKNVFDGFGGPSGRVKWCHSLAAGVDGLRKFIESSLTDPGNIPLTNGRGAFSSSLGEWAMACCLHFNKQIPRVQSNTRSKTWEKFTMPVLAGKTIGIVGFGDIGRAVARVAKPFGMRVLAMRRSNKPDPLADETYAQGTQDAQNAFLAKCDFVVSALPGTTETIDFFSHAAFGAMKPSAYFISIGRGLVVDEDALVEALKTKKIAGAALDVFKQEPLPETSPLWDCESCSNVLITAHNADYTEDYLDLGWRVWEENLFAFRAQTPLATPVDIKLGY